MSVYSLVLLSYGILFEFFKDILGVSTEGKEGVKHA